LTHQGDGRVVASLMVVKPARAVHWAMGLDGTRPCGRTPATIEHSFNRTTLTTAWCHRWTLVDQHYNTHQWQRDTDRMYIPSLNLSYIDQSLNQDIFKVA